MDASFILCSLVLSAALIACSSQEASPSASAEATSRATSSSSAPVASASAPAAVEVAPRPQAIVRAAFPARTTIFPLGRVLLACTDCRTSGKGLPSKPETVLVDRKGSKKVSLFPEADWRGLYQNNPFIFDEPRAVSFSGSYPDDFRARLDAPYDRGGYGSVTPLRAGASGWAAASDGNDPKAWACASSGLLFQLLGLRERCDDAGFAPLALKLVPALARAAEPPNRLVISPGGQAALVFDGGYARLVGDKWEKRPGPWAEEPDFAVALEDGGFVVASKSGVHLVSKDDRVAEVALAESGPEGKPVAGATELSLVPLGDEIWVSFQHGDKLELAAVDEASKWKRYLPALQQPDGEPPAVDLPNPVKLTDSCVTPFVMLASNNDPRYTFRATTEAFFGHGELQEALTFVQFTKEKTTFFGVQTKTREQAEKAAEIAKGIKLSPQLTCFDAVGHIPDLTRPPSGVRVYFANLAHKRLLWP